MSDLYPDVPDTEGVPPVLQDPDGDDDATEEPLDSDGDNLGSLSQSSQWGIFDDSGSQVIPYDSLISFEYSNEYKVSDYPVEQGAFETYNKVATPFDIRITLAKGGSIADRTAFFQAIENSKASFDLYTVITPEFSYTNANLYHADYLRKATNGVSLIAAEIFLKEIRVNATTAFSNTQDPASADATTPGGVTPQTPSTAQTAAVGNGDDDVDTATGS